MYRPGLDVVVVNYRTPDDLTCFLTSLNRYWPNIPCDAVVVNVDPLERDKRVAEDWAAFHGRAISFDWNAGYGRACNRAALLGDREAIVFFNADVMLTKGALDECHEALMSDDSWGVLGPRQTNSEKQLVAAGIFGTNEEPKHRGWLQVSHQYQDVRDDAIVVVGSAMFVKRSVWDQLRFCPIWREAVPTAEGACLDTQLFYEDAALSYHARAHGHRCVFYGPVTIHHGLHKSIKANRRTTTAASVWMPQAHQTFRAFCSAHGILCD